IQPVVIIPPPDFGFKVVGYFPYYRDLASIADSKFRMCNVINYAFATVDNTGSLVVNDPAVLAQVAAKAKANNTRLFISINGSVADFKSMSATAAGRNNFITALMNV